MISDQDHLLTDTSRVVNQRMNVWFEEGGWKFLLTFWQTFGNHCLTQVDITVPDVVKTGTIPERNGEMMTCVMMLCESCMFYLCRRRCRSHTTRPLNKIVEYTIFDNDGSISGTVPRKRTGIISKTCSLDVILCYCISFPSVRWVFKNPGYILKFKCTQCTE